MLNSIKKLVLQAFFLLFLSSAVFAANDSSGSIEGQVLDAATKEAISFVYLHIEQINRTATTDKNGKFTIPNIPAGTYTISLHRVGYTTRTVRVSIEESEEKTIDIQLLSQVQTGDEVIVTTETNGLTGSRLSNASIKMSGNELRRNLGTTLAETISSKSGFFQRTMGSAPARPVIRGLGDERVLILQDGERSGDVSATSADHAVSIDPVSANEIEVARGPSALAYGGNAIGGVINVVKNQIPTSVPSGLTGTGTVQGSSVNTGVSGAGNLSIPHNDWVLNLDLNGRIGGDYRSPAGTITNSGYATTNSAVGASYIRPWGYSGLAVSTYLSEYGIPPDPGGGHPNGVDIEMSKFQVDNRNEFLIRNHFLKLLEVQLSYRFYNHREFETEDIIGTEYVTNTGTFSVNARHQDIGFFQNGRIGVWGQVQDYIVIDRANIETITFNGAAYIIQEAEFDRFKFELGARLEGSVVQPHEERFTNLLGQIRRRSFLGLASSGSITYNLGRSWDIGSVVMHSYRPPSSEELFSQGPHIAAFTFEIGNPEIDAERGLGTELFIDYSGSSTQIRLTAFNNYFSNYIYPRDTGRESVPFPDLNEFQFEAVEANIFGVEAESSVRLWPSLELSGNLTYTVGDRFTEVDEEGDFSDPDGSSPLPMIPPLQANLGLEYTLNRLSLGGNIRHSLKQNRVAEFEEPTDASTVLNMNAQYRFTTSGNQLHTFSLNVDNLLNEEHRNHLSRLKEIFPEPGRNIRLLYRIYF